MREFTGVWLRGGLEVDTMSVQAISLPDALRKLTMTPWRVPDVIKDWNGQLVWHCKGKK